MRSPRALTEELDRKARAYPNSRGASLGRRYFVRRKPAAVAANQELSRSWYSLDGLYALES